MKINLSTVSVSIPSLLLTVLLLAACGRKSAPFDDFFAQCGPVVDCWIRDGRLYDGQDPQFRVADLLLRGDSIIFIGEVDSSRVRAGQVIDAGGRVVCPGFIDPHVHGDPLRTPAFANFLAMGVTTIALGQDGSSPNTEDPAGWMRQVDTLPPGVNIALFAGHGTLRQLSGIGFQPDPSPAELQRMLALLDRAFDAGCYGLSLGLEYRPGFFAGAAELQALARLVGERDGLIACHIRDEDDPALESSLRELLSLGSYCPVYVSHLKSVYGKGKARAEAILALLDSARRRSPHPVTTDSYPYTASYTGIGIVFPDWAKAPHDYETVKRERRDELLTVLRNKVRQRNGPQATLFGTAPYAGQTLEAVARSQQRPYEEVLWDIGPTGAAGAYFIMDEELQNHLLTDPYLMVGSDGSPTMHHPRGYGSFAKVIETLVLRDALLSLPEALRKMTSLPAATLGLKDRGTLAVGKKADLLVFDPEKVRANADFTAPHTLASGFDYVFVNGELAWAAGKITAGRHGRMLRKEK